jgi:PKD repeat protein
MTKFYIKFFILLGCIITFGTTAFAQGSSNKGTDFWLGYGKHVSTGNMVLYITSDVNTTSTVTIPALGFSQTVTITANTVSFVDIPTSAHLNNDGLSANGIHVTSLKPVIVYAHIYQTAVSGATLVLPVNTLGKDYYSINYKQESNSANSVSWFFVVAVEDDTQVEITPSATTQGGWAANTVHTVPLKKGEIYNVLGTFTNSNSYSNGVDLTGSKIKSISSNGTCKKIAVFSGSSKIAINCLDYNYSGTVNPGSADNLFQQVYPTATWGKSFITVPHKDRNFVIYRVVKSDPAAVVTLNGVVIPAASFVNNFYYEFASQKVDEISSDRAIQLVQYAVTQNRTITCVNAGGDVGDPEMIFLNPLEQTLTQITMYSTPRFSITKHFINVVIKNTGVSSFKLDGVNVASQFIAVPNNATYSYAQLSVGEGTHNLSSDVGFNATAYGFGNADSYGYAAGANLTAFGIEPINSTSTLAVQTGCVNNKYDLFLNLPYKAVELYLDRNDGNGLKVILLNLISETTKDGVTTYKYDLLPNLIYSTPATYTFKVRAIKPTIDDCGTGDEFTFDFIINPLPIADFNIPVNNCLNAPIQFAYKTDPNQTISNYLWDFNGEGTSTLEKPSFIFNPSNTNGTKKVRLSVKSAEGCWSTVVEKDVYINKKQVTDFTNSTNLCEKEVIQFTDISTSADGTIVKWDWNFGDVVSSTNTSTIQNPTHSYQTFKTYIVKLKTTTSSGCVDSISKSIIINPNPVVGFSNNSACYQTGATTFTNTSTIPDNTVLSYQWDFDDSSSGTNNTSTLKNPSHGYTKAGTFNVKLIVTSVNNCTQEIIKQVTVYPKPASNFNAPLQSCFNDNINFINTSSNDGVIITEYFWDFNGEATSSLQNPVYKFASAGVKQIEFSIKTDNGCWSDVFTKSIEVMQLPVANFNTATLKCEGSAFQFTNASTTIGQTIIEWAWDFGDATSTNNISNLQNPTHLFAKADTYAVKLTVKTDLGCINVINKNVIVNPVPIVMLRLCLPIHHQLQIILHLLICGLLATQAQE